MCNFGSAWKTEAINQKAKVDFNAQFLPFVQYEPVLPEIEIFRAPFSSVRAKLEELGVRYMVDGPADRIISYTNEEGWGKILPWLIYPADLYVIDDCDCDNYAKMASSIASFLFKLEGCFQSWGKIPMPDGTVEEHAFSLLWCGSYLRLSEPNSAFECAGEIFSASLDPYKGYCPKGFK
jgi:hypothetical protein